MSGILSAVANSYTAAGGGGGGYTMLDSDAAAFITATSISDNTIKQGIDELVIAIKAISSGAVWTALKVAYPFVGGSAATHAVNLKQPGTFNGTMNGTITHNSNGVTGDGSSGYINSGFNQSTNGATADEHVSVYSRTDVANSSYIDAGAAIGGGTRITLRNVTDFCATRNQNTTTGNTAVTSSLGYFSLNRTATTGYRLRQNATNTNITATNDSSLVNLNFCFLANNANGTISSFSARNLAWAALGRGLSQADDASLQAAVGNFQDFLSRGVV